MNLDWYRGIEPVLAVDPIFNYDHVTAFNIKTSKNKPHTIESTEGENFLIHNGFKRRLPPQSITPNPCRQFTPFTVLKNLKYKFRVSWKSSLSASNKLEFYHTVKSIFAKEAYLDHVKIYTDRVNLTRLRISAHRLEIEIGRWSKTPRNERICLWCATVLGTNTVENESHFINRCDLNAVSRRKVHQKIQKVLTEYQSRIIGTDHILTLTNPDCESTKQLPRESQCHLSRIIARFISQCLNNRKEFTDSAKQNS